MAKIGTAQIEIKPVLNDGALVAITEAIQQAVEKGVREGMAAAFAARELSHTISITGFPDTVTTWPLSGDNPHRPMTS